MVAKTPPMGWNSWDCYGAAVNEATVRANADFMAKHLKQYGWEYVVVDIQWSEPTAQNHEYHQFTELCMDEYSRLIPAENRFPSSAGGKGFAPLAEYVHSLGLKFGIHIMRGIPRQAAHRNTAIKGTDKTARQIAKTASICQWNTDMYGVDPEKDGAKAYYDSIFELYAEWGVDFIKCDDIARELPHEEAELRMLSDSLKNCGRDMVLSLSPGPSLVEKAELYKETANMWRITDDFWDKWELLYNMFERAEKWCIHSGEGHWPDCDMLPIGHILQDYDENIVTKFTQDEQITMLTLWCMMRSPLMIGGEMTKFDDFTMSLLTNEGLIEVLNSTHSAHPLFRKTVDGNEHIAWFTSHNNGKDHYIALFNAGESECAVTAKLPFAADFSVTDVWNGKNCGKVSDSVSADVKPHGAVLLKLTRE
ncbi:MAG: glycoside hydrolase family 27 protein [Oscillospiraceae bacterium]|nr:glycoside hydrolase family 27 protein [Oscillospiraceae bacterium]